MYGHIFHTYSARTHFSTRTTYGVHAFSTLTMYGHIFPHIQSTDMFCFTHNVRAHFPHLQCTETFSHTYDVRIHFPHLQCTETTHLSTLTMYGVHTFSTLRMYGHICSRFQCPDTFFHTYNVRTHFLYFQCTDTFSTLTMYGHMFPYFQCTNTFFHIYDVRTYFPHLLYVDIFFDTYNVGLRIYLSTLTVYGHICPHLQSTDTYIRGRINMPRSCDSYCD